jgi:MYXO-CTERM domain-containing protein
VRRVVASGNVARYGGGVYVSGPASPDAWASWVLTDNEASYGGGAVFVETAATSLVNGVLLSNAATELGAGLYAYDGSFDLRNAAVAWNLGAAAVYAESADITAAYDAWWENPDGNTHGFAPTDAVLAAPGFVDYRGDGDATDDTFALWRSSALIDAGDPALSDADGSRSDIGVRGGAWFVPEDADGDGASTATDCDDTDPATLPGAPDAWYDGADTNCDGASDYDQDGDGLDAQLYGGPDCDDTDAAVGPCPGEDTATPDDTGVPDTNTASDADTDGADAATPKDDAEGCGCATPSAAPNPAWAGLVALGTLVRRRVRGVRGTSRA